MRSCKQTQFVRDLAVVGDRQTLAPWRLFLPERCIQDSRSDRGGELFVDEAAVLAQLHELGAVHLVRRLQPSTHDRRQQGRPWGVLFSRANNVKETYR